MLGAHKAAAADLGVQEHHLLDDSIGSPHGCRDDVKFSVGQGALRLELHLRAAAAALGRQDPGLQAMRWAARSRALKVEDAPGFVLRDLHAAQWSWRTTM